MYIFHIIEKNVKQRGVHFSPIWKKYHKIQEGGGCQIIYFAKLPQILIIFAVRDGF